MNLFAAALKKDGTAGHEAKISFCMIVKDGGDSLSTCLESVRPLVDEIIVVDTGSTDDTLKIAKSLGSRVISTTWQQDFASARNVYLRAAKHPWILSLDSDETIACKDPVRFRNILSESEDAAFVFTIKNYFVMSEWTFPMAPSEFGGEIEPGIGWTPSRTIRLFSRKSGLAYRYPVHESLVPAVRAQGMKIRQCGVPIRHVGALQPVCVQRAKHSMYRDIGIRKLVQYPRYFRGYLELGKVCLAEGDLDNAEQLFKKCICLNPFFALAYYYWISLALIRGRPDEAKRRAILALRMAPKNLDLQYALGLAELELGNNMRAATSLAPAMARMPHLFDPFAERALDKINGPSTLTRVDVGSND